MSRAKSSLLFIALSVVASVGACTSVPNKEASADADFKSAMEAALAPATPAEVAAANRADPLTRANFWSKEYSKDPENLDTALTFARTLRDIGSDTRAIEVLSQVMVVHPNSAELCMVLGRAFMKTHATGPAATAFTRAAELEPKRAEAWGALGTALDRLERHTDAQRAYAQALKLEPGRAVTLTNYGLSLALTGDLAGAEEKLRLAAGQPSAPAMAQENLALVLGLQGRFDDMRAASSPAAPLAVIDANITALQEMVSPSRTWEMMASGKPAATAPAPSAPNAAPQLRLDRSAN